MIIAKITIAKVSINLDSNGKLIYILPNHFDGADFSKFKTKYKSEISAFKSMYKDLDNKPVNFVKIESNSFSINVEIICEVAYYTAIYSFTLNGLHFEFLRNDLLFSKTI